MNYSTFNFTFVTAEAQATLAKILLLLAQRPHTWRELAAAVGIHEHTMRAYVNHLRNNKEVRVCERRKNKCGPRELVFALGSDPDVPNVREMHILERKQRVKVRLVVRRDPLTAMFFGAAT